MIRLALYQPDIPQNMGTLMRLGACLDVPIDVIGPTGFDLSDRALRRAGMDYLEKVDLTKHLSYEKYKASDVRKSSRLIICSTKATIGYTEFSFESSDTIMLGRESSGLPDEVHAEADGAVKIPMANEMRSLNVAIAGGIIIAEALRQTESFSKL